MLEVNDVDRVGTNGFGERGVEPVDVQPELCTVEAFAVGVDQSYASRHAGVTGEHVDGGVDQRHGAGVEVVEKFDAAAGAGHGHVERGQYRTAEDRKSTRLNSSH